MKRLVDIIISTSVLIVFGPVILVFMLLIWLQDFHTPLYIALRIGKNGLPFRMVKLRSMKLDSDKTGVSSTSTQDARITPMGTVVRRYKLDELMQFWNVLLGDMSLVGPRPQVKSGVDIYTTEEHRLLSLRPGITDMASIVFSDEGDILANSTDPDLDYEQLIRPWKSRLGLLYCDKASPWLDIRLVVLTALALFNKKNALRKLQTILSELEADTELKRVALREDPLLPTPPPGSDKIVTSIHPDGSNAI